MGKHCKSFFFFYNCFFFFPQSAEKLAQAVGRKYYIIIVMITRGWTSRVQRTWMFPAWAVLVFHICCVKRRSGEKLVCLPEFNLVLFSIRRYKKESYSSGVRSATKTNLMLWLHLHETQFLWPFLLFSPPRLSVFCEVLARLPACREWRLIIRRAKL